MDVAWLVPGVVVLLAVAMLAAFIYDLCFKARRGGADEVHELRQAVGLDVRHETPGRPNMLGMPWP